MQPYPIEKQIVYSLAFLLAILILASCVMPVLPTTATPSITPNATGQAPAPTTIVTGLENTSWQLVAFGLVGVQTSVIADNYHFGI